MIKKSMTMIIIIAAIILAALVMWKLLFPFIWFILQGLISFLFKIF